MILDLAGSSPIKKGCSALLYRGRAGEREVCILERESEPKPCGRGGKSIPGARAPTAFSSASTQTTTERKKKEQISRLLSFTEKEE
jgi:hypothetical protein